MCCEPALSEMSDSGDDLANLAGDGGSEDGQSDGSVSDSPEMLCAQCSVSSKDADAVERKRTPGSNAKTKWGKTY